MNLRSSNLRITMLLCVGAAIGYTPPSREQISAVHATLDLVAKTVKNWVTYKSITEVPSEHYPQHFIPGKSIATCHGTSSLKDICRKGFKFVFLMHGWMGDEKSTFPQDLKNEICRSEPETVVVIFDWNAAAKNGSGLAGWLGLSYANALLATKKVGYAAANSIKVDFIDNECTAYKDIHLIGHSLGAIAFSWTAFFLKEIEHFTALDPPGWIFLLDIPNIHYIYKGVAKFVEVWHTSFLSFRKAQGDLDVFVNNAWMQPGCPGLHFASVPFIGQKAMYDTVECTHARAYKIYAESVSRCFSGYLCSIEENVNVPEDIAWDKSCNTCPIQVGYKNSGRAKGVMFLPTAGWPPYSFLG